MAGAVKHAEVRWYRFAKPDKRRPVLVLSRSSAIPYLGELTVAPITSTVRGIPSEVPLGPSDGMPRECAVNLDHLQTVQKARIGALVTTLRPERMDEVREAILFALEL